MQLSKYILTLIMEKSKNLGIMGLLWDISLDHANVRSHDLITLALVVYAEHVFKHFKDCVWS